MPFDPDNIDESLETHNPGVSISVPDTNADAHLCIEVEDSLGELTLSDEDAVELQSPQVVMKKIIINGKLTAKGQALSQYSTFRKFVSSTDCLQCVQEVKRYVNKANVTTPCSDAIQVDETHSLIICNPITTLICSENKFWLCIGEVNSLKIDGRSADYISHDMLSEDTVIVSLMHL